MASHPPPAAAVDALHYAAVKALVADLYDALPEERAARLAAAPPELRAEAGAMLAAEAASRQGFRVGEGVAMLEDTGGLDLSAFEASLEGVGEPPDPMLGARVGAYLVEGRLGEGGMGRVYGAVRADGLFEQEVALKVVKRGMDTAAVLRRFEAERRILAGLRHPGIARVLDAGETDDGRPYLAMERVDGPTLTAYADRHALGLSQRVALMAEVCDAVAHAHRHLVVHRDLKPSNVLVEADDDGAPRPVLLDFGIARVLEGDGEALTQTGARMMTRPYAAPEQVAGEAVTTATDVWALGVLLYELLVGRRPFASDSRHGLETAILEAAPTLPSVVAARDEARDPASTASTATGAGRARRLRGDLDAICLTALAREPERRYATAEGLADDLGRFLGGLPVEARPPAAGYRIRKFAGRHRTAVAVGAAALVALVAGAAYYTVQLRAERDRAEAALSDAEATADFLTQVFVAGDPFDRTRRDTLSLDDVLDASLALIGERLENAPAVQGTLYTRVAVAFSAQGRFAEADSLFELAHARLAGEWTQARATALKRHADLIVRSADADRFYQAAEQYRQVIGFYERHYGPEHEGTAGIQTSLAMTLLRAGEPEGADRYFQQALRRYAARDTLDTTSYAVALSQHAMLLNDRGDGDDALAALEESLRLTVAQLGSDHPRVAVKHYHLGGALYDAGRYDEAAEAYERSRAIDAAELGPDHPHALNAERKIGLVRSARGRGAEGAAQLREALARLEATQPPGTPLIPLYRLDLSRALLAAGRPADARAQAARALGALRAAHDDGHVRVALARAALGEAELDSGEAATAVGLLRDAVRVLEAEYVPARPALVRAQVALARAYVAAGQPSDARAPLQAALAGTEARFGAGHTRTRELRDRLVDLGDLAGAP